MQRVPARVETEAMKPPSTAHAVLAHYFHGPGFAQAQGSLSVEEWEAGLDAYGSRLVPAQEWITRCLHGTQKDEVCVSFDDGLREAYVLALPALETRGLTAAWNVYTGPYVGVPNNLERWRWLRNHGFGGIEGFYDALEKEIGVHTAPVWYLADRGYLTERDIHFRYWRDHEVTPAEYEAVMQRLFEASRYARTGETTWISPTELRHLHAEGHVLGIHTHSHPTDIRALSREHQSLEYATSRAILAGVLHVEAASLTTVSHPCGAYTNDGLGWLRRHGFTLAWGATMGGEAPWVTPRWSTGYWRER